MIYCDICSFQPMEIYVDDEAKLTLHGLVQVCILQVDFQLIILKFINVNLTFMYDISALHQVNRGREKPQVERPP